jgi:hypothetical protein
MASSSSPDPQSISGCGWDRDCGGWRACGCCSRSSFMRWCPEQMWGLCTPTSAAGSSSRTSVHARRRQAIGGGMLVVDSKAHGAWHFFARHGLPAAGQRGGGGSSQHRRACAFPPVGKERNVWCHSRATHARHQKAHAMVADAAKPARVAQAKNTNLAAQRRKRAAQSTNAGRRLHRRGRCRRCAKRFSIGAGRATRAQHQGGLSPDPLRRAHLVRSLL